MNWPLSVASFLGGAVVAVFLAWATAREFRAAVRMWAFGLFVAALIYIGFALRPSGHGMLRLEAAGLVLYGGVALLAVFRTPWYLAIGWLCHVAWDLLQPASARAVVPSWYPPACAGFDLVIAMWLVAAVTGRVRWAAAQQCEKP